MKTPTRICGGTLIPLLISVALVGAAVFVAIVAIRASRIEAQDQINAVQQELQAGHAFADAQSEIIDAQARVIAALQRAEATNRTDEKQTAIAEAAAGMEKVQKVYRRLEISAQGAQELNK